MTERKYALFASTSLLVMAFIAFFSYGFVHRNLVIQRDASTTFHNIQTSNSLFKAEIFGWIIIFLTDIVAAWALYFFLKPIYTSLSLLAALLRLMYTAILGIAIFNLILALLLSKNTIANPETYTILFLSAFEYIWSVGLIIFGLHLFVLGYVAFLSKQIPKFISILLFIAAVHYCSSSLSVVNLFIYFFNISSIFLSLLRPHFYKTKREVS